MGWAYAVLCRCCFTQIQREHSCVNMVKRWCAGQPGAEPDEQRSDDDARSTRKQHDEHAWFHYQAQHGLRSIHGSVHSSLVVTSCARDVLPRQHVHAHMKHSRCILEGSAQICPFVGCTALSSHTCALQLTVLHWSQHTCYLLICLVADYCAHDGAAPNMADLRVSCMQSHLQYASSFNPAHRAMWPAV
jgi:hypothetical protein